MKISLCTTCHNRAHQLKKTFEANLEVLKSEPDVEWVILNYNSSDDLHAYMLRQITRAGGRVVYAVETSGRPWHCSVAKNIAHKISSGDVLMNLDCDNWIADAIRAIKTELTATRDVLHLSSGLGDGTFGRIIVRRSLFFQFGGYDENLHPMGYQDSDLLERLKTAGAVIKVVTCATGITVQNTKEESILNCRIASNTWDDFQRMNRQMSINNIVAGRLVANAGAKWGAGRLTFFSDLVGPGASVCPTC